MSNIQLREKHSLIREKTLAKLSDRLQSSLGSENFYTAEQYLSEAAQILSRFYSSLDKPLEDKALQPHKGDLPDAEKYNLLMGDIKDSLEILFAEFETVEDFILASFNYAITSSNRLNGYLKRIYSLVGDYSLYVDTGQDISFIRDSFDSLDKVDIGSSLVNGDECTVIQDLGMITLPIDINKETAISIYKSPILNPNSNGFVGNNEEIGVEWNGDPNVITDNNADTWFEYERVTSIEEDTGDSLILDLTLLLEDPKIINYIRINPNNFGTRTAIKIDTIETSLDGVDFLNIKDDIPLIACMQEDEENVFSLNPATSKYAGQGIYLFTPRKVKYIHCVFSQSVPYSIETSNGTRLRYAIGIRDIEVQAIPFLSKGEIVSREFTLSRELSKAAMEITQNPSINTELATIKHYLSVDNGITWKQIQPQAEKGTSGVISEIPEILNYNNADPNSINTPFSILTIRYKAEMERNDDVFQEGNSALYLESSSITESYELPTTAPHSLVLTHVPLENTVQIVDPSYGSRGDPRRSYKIGSGGGIDLYVLPDWGYINEKRPWKKEAVGTLYNTIKSNDSDWINVLIGGNTWASITEDWSGYGINDTVYQIDWNNNTLRFGDGTHGKVPPEQMGISIYLEAERLAAIDGPNTPIRLAFPTANEKKNIIIKRYGTSITETINVPKGSEIIETGRKNLTSVALGLGGLSLKTFLNGVDEFTGDDQYSYNADEGIIYLSSPHYDLTTVTIVYSPITVLSEEDWDWISSENEVNDQIMIKESGWDTVETTFEPGIPTPWPGDYVYTLHLPHLEIIKRTVKIFATVSTGTNPFLAEIPYIDGIKEFESLSSTGGYYSIDYHKGTIYTQLTQANIDSLSIRYEYSNFEIIYGIAKLVSKDKYVINYTDKEIFFDNSIMAEIDSISATKQRKHQISYRYVSKSREDVSLLKDYYTPVIKDYVLKVVPQESE